MQRLLPRCELKGPGRDAPTQGRHSESMTLLGRSCCRLPPLYRHGTWHMTWRPSLHMAHGCLRDGMFGRWGPPKCPLNPLISLGIHLWTAPCWSIFCPRLCDVVVFSCAGMVSSTVAPFIEMQNCNRTNRQQGYLDECWFLDLSVISRFAVSRKKRHLLTTAIQWC